MLCICPSIQPKQRASSSASPAFTVLGPPALPNSSQTPSLDRQFSESQARKAARSSNRSSSSIVIPPYWAMILLTALRYAFRLASKISVESPRPVTVRSPWRSFTTTSPWASSPSVTEWML